MISENENSKEYYVKNLEKYEELDIENSQILIENIGKSTFGMGIILCSIPIAFASNIDGINNISAVVSLAISGCMFVSGSFITINDLFDIANSIAKKISCTNKINEIKAKLNIIYNNQLESNNNCESKKKIKHKKIR